ncbi:MAG: 4-deoxy-4-formamido-L-arabinose-phosphoundecaprenol deformylase, partial [Gallionellaceae bacterium]|nr:4-deoxy-4-formamido-L-arabinose-phosphoundecaprenol deformylase [Gallionellaceae bacterium]
PFIPMLNAEPVACPQLPTTLPTLDEILNRDGVTEENAAEYLLRMTEQETPTGHVFTLHAELEGGKLLPLFEQLLAGWQAQGYEAVSMREYYEKLSQPLPHCEVVMREIDGRVGTLAGQA